MWASPLKPKKEKKESSHKQSPPNEELEKFKKPKLTLTKSEAKKILDYKKDLAYRQIEWVQNWLQTVISERSLPPQLAGEDAYAQIMLFLNPLDALALLKKIREEFLRTVPPEEREKDDYAFLAHLDLGAYHEHLPPPHTSSRNNRTQDDAPLYSSKTYREEE